MPSSYRLLAVLFAVSWFTSPQAVAQRYATYAGQTLPGLPFWKWQNPLPQGYILNDLCALTDSAALLVGDHGTALRTADQGSTWTPVAVGTDRDLVSVDFATPLVGWVGYSTPATNLNSQTGGVGPGEIRRTTNGGQTWTRQPIGENYSVRMRKVMALSTTTVYVWYDWARRYPNGLYGNFTSRLRRSTNGGSTWAALPTPLPISDPASDVVFPSATTGFVGGENLFGNGGWLVRTRDGGTTWANIAPDAGQLRVKSLCFIDDQRGWVAGSRTLPGAPLLRTTDGGTTWQPIALPVQPAGPVSVVNLVRFAPDALHGLVQVNNTTFLRTADGGLTWTTIGAGSITWELMRPPIARIRPSGVTWLQTADYTLRKAPTFTDSLRRAYDVRGFTSDRFTQVDFPDPGTGWIGAGARFIDFNGLSSWWIPGGNSILRTTDRGDHWQVLPLSSLTAGQVAWPPAANSFLTTTAFPDRDTAYAAGVEFEGDPRRAAFVVRTTDGGTTWARLPLPATRQAPFKLSFLDGRRGIVVGDSGVAFITTDAGQSWRRTHISGRHRLYTVGWVDAQHLYAGGDSTNVARSADGGLTWTVTSQDSSGIFGNGAASYQPSVGNSRNLYFTTPSRGYTAGDNTIARTTNGGTTWFYGLAWFNPPRAIDLYIQGGRTSQMNQVVFRTPQEGYAFGNDQQRTVDGGFTWTLWAQTTTPTQAGALVDRYNAYAVGENGTILRYSEKFIQTDTALARTSFCLSGADSLQVPFTTEGSFAAAEQDFRVELSNARGRFRKGETTLIGQGTASPLLAHLPATLPAGTYRLRVIRADSSVLGADNGTDLHVTRRPAAVTLAPADSAAICAGDSVQLTAPAGFSVYHWSTGDTTAAIWVRAAGAYAVQVGAAAGCLSPASDSVRVRVKPMPPQPIITMGPPASGSIPLTSSAASGNQWFLNGQPISGATGPTYAVSLTNPVVNGRYSVQVTHNGCVSPVSAEVPVIVTATPDARADALVSVAPNPARTSAVVRTTAGELARLSLTELTGRVVVRTPARGLEAVLNLAGVPSGTYLLRTELRDGTTVTRRLVVEK